MFVPNQDQAAINQRALDIEDVKKQHAQFLNKYSVDYKILVNRMDKMLAKQAEDGAATDSLVKAVRILSEQYSELLRENEGLLGLIKTQTARLDEMERLKIDLVGKINAARKRIDEN